MKTSSFASKDKVVVVSYDERLPQEEVLKDVEELTPFITNPKYQRIVLRYQEVDGDILVDRQIASEPFQRIRRITGYLVGTLDSFNDGKSAEEKDRVKHQV